MNKIVVYTCIFGNYDCLKPVVNPSSSIDYICFTDNPNLESDGVWKIRQFVPDIYTENLSPIKKQRMIKILPHVYLKEYDISLWVDGNIQITGNLIFEFFNNLDDEKIMYVNRHLARDCIYREEVEVIRLKKDKPENTNKQIARYRAEGFPEHFGLAETNIIVRRHNDFRCKKLMFDWAKEIVNGSHRDQLSFDYCRWKNGMSDYIGWLECNKYYTTNYDVFRIYHHGQKMRPIFVLNNQNKFKIVPNKTEQEQKPQAETIDNKEDKKVEDNKENKIAEDKAKEKLKNEVEKIKEENNNISNSLKEKLKVIEALKQKLEIANNKNTKLENINTVNAEEIKELNSSISVYEAKINKLNATLEGFKKLVENHKTQDSSTKKIIQNLENTKKELEKKLQLELDKQQKAKEEKEQIEASYKKNILGVVITTHNRTHIAQATIKSLIDNLKFNGTIKWCIADDRSREGHAEELLETFYSNDIPKEDVFVCKTNSKSFGLGASLNNGLQTMFKFTEVVLTTEDDWFLQKELDINGFVEDIKKYDIAQIRLGAVNYRPNNLIHFSYLKNYNKLLLDYRRSNQRLTINLQVCLRHKRCYDRLGFYDTNINSDKVEQNFNAKYENYVRSNSDKLLVLAPSNLVTNTLDCEENWFVHIGPSTIGHKQFQVPFRYKVIEDKIDYRNFQFNHHKNTLNICLITDENYVIPTMTLIQSIHNNSGFKNIRKTDIYVLGVRLTETSKTAFNLLNDSLHKDSVVETNVIVKDVSEEIISRSLDVYKKCHPNKHSVGSSTLIKFNIWNILTDIDECLYIDTDIVCEKNLFDIQNFFTKKNKELMDETKKNYVIGAVPLSNHHIKFTLNRQPLGVDVTFARVKPYYFNAGILYLNLKELRKGNYTDILFNTKLSIAQNNSTLKYNNQTVKCTGCDQDTFNYVFDTNKSKELCLVMPFEFNVNAIEFPMELPKLKLNYGNFELFKHLCINNYVTLEESLNDGYLYHFTLNPLKPWKLKSYSQNKNIDRFIKLWWKEFKTIDKNIFSVLTKEQMSVICKN